MADAPPRDFIGFLDYHFAQKFPYQIPPGGRDWLVRFGPWIVVLLLLLSVPTILLLLGIGATSPFTEDGYRYAETSRFLHTYAYWPWTTGFIVHAVLLAMALPGLFARRMSGWRLAFYAGLVSAAASLVALAIGSTLEAIMTFYILFQIRPLYK